MRKVGAFALHLAAKRSSVAVLDILLGARAMVDAADHEKIDASKNELHNLLEKPQLAGIPILVLGNKRDLEGALDENGLIERLNLRAVQVMFQFSLNQAKN